MSIFEANATTMSSFPATDDWGQDDELEDLSETSHEDATMVFHEWKENNYSYDLAVGGDSLDIMEVDEQIGSDLLSDEIFGGNCQGTAPIVYTSGDADNGFVGRPVSDDEEDDPAISKKKFSGFEERYKATLQKLSESMMKSQESRKSLTIKTPNTEEYSRSNRVSGVLSSSEESAMQLQELLNRARVVASRSA